MATMQIPQERWQLLWWQTPLEAEKVSLAEKTFQELSAKWHKETKHTSSLTKIILHPAYQQIIGMGPMAIKFILQELEPAFHKMIAGFLPAVISEEENSRKTEDQNFEFSLQTKKSEELSKVLFEKLCLHRNTILQGNFNSQNNEFQLKAEAPEIDIADRKLKDFEISALLSLFFGAFRPHLPGGFFLA